MIYYITELINHEEILHTIEAEHMMQALQKYVYDCKGNIENIILISKIPIVFDANKYRIYTTLTLFASFSWGYEAGFKQIKENPSSIRLDLGEKKVYFDEHIIPKIPK